MDAECDSESYNAWMLAVIMSVVSASIRAIG